MSSCCPVGSDGLLADISSVHTARDVPPTFLDTLLGFSQRQREDEGGGTAAQRPRLWCS